MTQKRQTLKPILAYPNKSIAQLSLQINQQLAILGQIKSVLPIELQVHVLHSVLNGKKLLIYTDSANWATQLRFYGETMLAVFKSNCSTPATVLQVKIINDVATAKVNPKNKATIPSQRVSYEIRKLSLVTTDPQLKQALSNLSSTLARLNVRK
jgi:hypothetical protein